MTLSFDITLKGCSTTPKSIIGRSKVYMKLSITSLMISTMVTTTSRSFTFINMSFFIGSTPSSGPLSVCVLAEKKT